MQETSLLLQIGAAAELLQQQAFCFQRDRLRGQASHSSCAHPGQFIENAQRFGGPAALRQVSPKPYQRSRAYRRIREMRQPAKRLRSRGVVVLLKLNGLPLQEYR